MTDAVSCPRKAARAAALSLSLAFATAPAVHAQDAAADAGEALPTIPLPADPPPPPPASAAVDDAALGEVIVTAQKRRQSLQDVPLSVGVVGGETLGESANFDAGAIENFVANVQIDADPQGPVVGIRGFSTETDNVGFEPAVGIVFDQLALGRSEFVPDGLYDLDRVEVLRGPQGTLFGKNTIAGVINFVTVEPKDDVDGYLTLTGADPLQRRAEAALNLPLADGLAARASGVYWKKLGDVDNSTLGRKENSFVQRAGRLKLLATPGARWKLGLSTQLSDTSVDYNNWQMYAAAPAALAYAQGYDASAEDDGLDAHTTQNTPGVVDRHSHIERGVIEYDAGDLLGAHDVTFTTVLGHAGFSIRSFFDIDTSAADIVNTRFDVDSQQNSIEFRPNGRADSLFGLGGGVDWTLGLYAYYADLDSHLDTIAGDNLVDFALSSAGLEALGIPSAVLGPILDALPQLPPIPLNDQLLRGFAQTTESYAAFGQMTWKLSERLSTIAGLRYGWEQKRADFDTRRVGLGIVAAVVGAEPFTAERERREIDLSPKLGLQYAWSRDVMNFITWTRGYKGGGFNATADTADNLEFKPEKAAAWEAGIKSRWFDHRLTVNAALYYTDVDDLQTVDNEGTRFIVGNAAKARLQGVELETQWRALNWLQFVSSLAYGSAEYRSYPNAPAASEDDADTQDLGGKTLAHAPKFSGALSPIVTVALPAELSLKLAADLSYRSGQYSSVDLDSHSHQDGYWLVGGRIVLLPDSGRWSFIVSGNNLTNERALDLVFNNAVFAHTYVAQQIPLRSVAASLQLNW